MINPEELLPRETWRFVLSKLSTKDDLSCRCVCNSFKEEVDSILNKNKDRLWLRLRVYEEDDYTHYFCYDKDHRISSRDTLYFGRTICIENLKFVSALMPSLRILQLDPLDVSYCRNYYWDNAGSWPHYRNKNGKAIPITKIFPQVSCLILPGQTETDNFVGDLSQVKHLTLLNVVLDESPTFSNLHSLEVRNVSKYNEKCLSMPSKRFVVPQLRIEWRSLPKTLQVIDTELNFREYISVGKPYFSNLKILRSPYEPRYYDDENLESLINFLKDHKGSLTELSFSALEEVANIKVLVPLLTRLHKLSVRIISDEQAIELKEIKALAHNLKYFELSFDESSSYDENFGPILENLPIDLDHFSIKGVIYPISNTRMKKIMEKVLNGETRKVTIEVCNGDKADPLSSRIMEKFVKIKPEAVRVEKRNLAKNRKYCGFRRGYVSFEETIMISL